ncbi:MAG: class I SAM-dependent methyltransferase [Anaerolineae bacterium]|nr:class I SAM-dependent methyltransferase [Anaerolineae bacterium]
MDNTPASPFDAVAARYDSEATDPLISRWLRGRVWKWLASLYPAGSRVLEIGCGTGEDAVWLAKQGVHVTASDVSTEMLVQAQRKAEREEVADRISFLQLDLAQAAHWELPGSSFDGAYSNFGALNCVEQWRDLGVALAAAVRPGGKIGFVVMPPFCVWESLWHATHGDLKTATRRWRGQSMAQIEGVRFPVYYPAPQRLRRDLGSAFEVQSLRGLGVFLPPSDIQPVVAKRPAFAKFLLRLERLTAALPLFKRIGDHYWIELKRL